MNPVELDVLCIGHACYDLVFAVDHHPQADEKLFANSLLSCGGGPAANAAVMVAKLGFKAGFCGYLGNDLYGDTHALEFLTQHVDTCLLVRGQNPTPLSAVLVKPDGQRALINYKGDTTALAGDSVNMSNVVAKTVLFDGHEPQLAQAFLADTAQRNVTSVLDAGSVHAGTLALMKQVTYLVASEKFARQYGGDDLQAALSQLAAVAPVAVITLGEHGLIWQRGSERGALPAYPVTAVDTTGAGDAFHGAFAAGVAQNLEWQALLRYASAAGSLCCTQMGARLSLPDNATHHALFATPLF